VQLCSGKKVFIRATPGTCCLCVVCKPILYLFDLILLHSYSDIYELCDLQFDFKKNRSTAMCTMIVKEAISLYTSSNSTVHSAFMASSKAFDRVEYCKLFKLLMDRHVPPHVTRILFGMYTGQSVQVL